VLLLALVAGAAVALGRSLLAEATTTPVVPPPVATAAARWSGPLELPVSLPPCLRYAPDGAAVVPDSQARSGWALTIRLIGSAEPACSGWQDAAVLLQEADALQSLPGDVTTTSADRMQFARVAETNASGQTELTVQWRCHDLMCRASATLAGPLDEPTLVQLAAGFEQVPG
jgi:hypothetical protein